ncbi:MAG: M48 family metallopeptidase [Gemmatimonadales bacterium]
MSEGNLFEQQASNRRRSIALVAAFLLFFAWIGFGGDFIFYLSTAEAPAGNYHHVIPLFGIAATLLAAVLARHGWRKGPSQILWATGAWQLLNASKPQEKVLINVVEEMAIASGVPRPTIWIVPDKDPNAFATGHDEQNAHVAVTEGLLETLSRDELQAVVAHEMAHIRNHDAKLMTLLAALVGVMAIISDGTSRMLRFGGARKAGPRSKRSSGKGGGPLIAILLAVWLLSVILAPIVSRLLAVAVSRKREFLADATAAQFTRDPGSLASALRKIEDARGPTKTIKRGSAHLCIADPLGRRLTHKEGAIANLLATHPPMAVRIARLKRMAYQYDKTGSLRIET